MRNAIAVVALGALALAACGGDGAGPEGPTTPAVAAQAWPLWGGETDTEHAGVVMIGHSRQPPSCSGTLIAPNLAITAHHCVAEILNAQDMDVCNHQFGTIYARPYVFLGDSLFGPYDIFLASEVVVPDNCASTCGCDIALLILERSVPDPSIAIGVESSKQPYEGEPFDLVAFGTTNQMQSGFGVRRRRAVSVQCFSWGCGPGALATNEFAATSGGCEGDSGGAGIDDAGLLIGVISRTSFPCDAPDALNLYTSVQWSLDLVAATARKAATQGGYPAPAWAAPPASVCATARLCGPHMEADGTAVDCGACVAPDVCGADGTCAAPIAAPGPSAGAGGGPVGEMFQGVWCEGVVCPADWVCAGDPPTCRMSCDPGAPACEAGTSCDAVSGACLPAPGAASADGGPEAELRRGGACAVTGAPTGSAHSFAASMVLVAAAAGLRRRRRDARHQGPERQLRDTGPCIAYQHIYRHNDGYVCSRTELAGSLVFPVRSARHRQDDVVALGAPGSPLGRPVDRASVGTPDARSGALR